MKSTYEKRWKKLEKYNLVKFSPRKRLQDRLFWIGFILFIINIELSNVSKKVNTLNKEIKKFKKRK